MAARKPAGSGLLMAAAILVTGCDGDPAEPTEFPDVHLAEVAAGLSQPVHLTAPPGDPRLFVVEQPGRIRVIQNGQLLAAPFLDLTGDVVTGGERGLLGLAFHPGYATNGTFFVNYTGAGGATRIERFRVSDDPNRADPASRLRVLTVGQPFGNHNGGLLEFGPDGMLYIGMGDGGSGGDPQGHGQDSTTLLGALLRIDVDAGDPYVVPSDNPFVDQPHARPEIWATGLRNPWRFSFDPEAGLLWVADVGQNRREEINAVPATQGGLNYGWNIMEGSLCFSPMTGCDVTGLVLPILEYDNPGEGCSVTGGYVYRGTEVPELQGHYFYGDFCRGWVRSFRRTQDGGVQDEREWPFGDIGRITSFGQDGVGELYVVVLEGRVLRLSR